MTHRHYRHFKGGIYTVLYIARHSEDESEQVVYKNSKNQTWVRPLKEWNEPTDRWPDGIVRPRFVPFDEVACLNLFKTS
jgi:hypothetical protein